MAVKGQRWKNPRYRQPRKLKRKTPNLVCRHRQKPSAARQWGAKSAARAICAAMNHGVTKKQIDAAVKVECGGAESRPRPDSAAEAAMEVAMEALTNSTEELGNAYTLFLAINAVLLGIMALGLVVPVARPLRIVAAAARTQVAALVRVNIRTRAANDAAFDQLRRGLEQLRRAA